MSASNPMHRAGWGRESTEEYDDGYTRESFERAEEDGPEDRPSPTFVSAREAAIDEQVAMDDNLDPWEAA